MSPDSTGPVLARFVAGLLLLTFVGAGVVAFVRSDPTRWSTFSAPTPIATACTLVTTPEASRLFGGQAQRVPFGATRAASICQWTGGAAPGVAFGGARYRLVIAVFDNVNEYDIERQLFAKVSDVDGLGDRAELLGALHPEPTAVFAWIVVQSKGRTYTLNYSVTNMPVRLGPESFRANAVTLARAMLRRAD